MGTGIQEACFGINAHLIPQTQRAFHCNSSVAEIHVVENLAAFCVLKLAVFLDNVRDLVRFVLVPGVVRDQFLFQVHEQRQGCRIVALVKCRLGANLHGRHVLGLRRLGGLCHGRGAKHCGEHGDSEQSNHNSGSFRRYGRFIGTTRKYIRCLGPVPK